MARNEKLRAKNSPLAVFWCQGSSKDSNYYFIEFTFDSFLKAFTWSNSTLSHFIIISGFEEYLNQNYVLYPMEMTIHFHTNKFSSFEIFKFFIKKFMRHRIDSFFLLKDLRVKKIEKCWYSFIFRTIKFIKIESILVLTETVKQ